MAPDKFELSMQLLLDRGSTRYLVSGYQPGTTVMMGLIPLLGGHQGKGSVINFVA